MILCRLSDKYCKRKILTLVLLGLILTYIMIFFGGRFEIKPLVYYYFVFILNGLAKSLMFPSMISILADWFTRKNRGLIFGLFMSG